MAALMSLRVLDCITLWLYALLQIKFVLLLRQAHFVGVMLFDKGILDKQNRERTQKLYGKVMIRPCVSVGYAFSRQKVPLCWPEIPYGLAWHQLGPPRWEAGDHPPEPWHGRCLQLLKCFPHGDRILPPFITVTLNDAPSYNTNLLESVNCLKYFIWNLVFFNSFSIWSSRACTCNTKRILVILASGYLQTIQVHSLSDTWPVWSGWTCQTHSFMLKNCRAGKYPISSLFHEARNLTFYMRVHYMTQKVFCTQKQGCTCDFRLLPWCKWDVHSSGMSQSTGW